MKKILSMAALALIMAGCSNDNDEVKIDNGEAANAVAIQISQKVAGVESKAAIAPGSKMQAVIMMVDAGSTDSPDFSAFTPKTENVLGGTDGKTLEKDANRATVATTQFEAKTSAETITLTPKLYYPVESSNSSKNTWLFGVSPLGSVAGTVVTFNETDGLQDVMYAKKAAAGSKDSHSTDPALEFEHKTTQLTFVSKLSGELTGSDWEGKSVTVKNIVIQSAQVPASLNFSDGTVNWTTGANLTVAGCNTVLTTTACKPSVPVMVKAGGDIKVNLELSVAGTIKWYNNLTVQNSSNNGNLVTIEASSHEITFNITPPKTASDGTEIAATAKIVDWHKGEAGNVEIK